MRNIVVLSMISLDGVLQSPGAPKEDTEGNFEYGGWVAPFDDDVYNNVVIDELKPADYLLGRKTYEIWANYWPDHGDIWPGIMEGNKYVFSQSLTNSDKIISNWKNSLVIKSLEEIRSLKKLDGPDIQVWGSSELIHLLLKNDLVDELKLKIHPVILGKGKKLFSSESMPCAYDLLKTIITPGGVIIAYYKRAGKVITGTIGA